MGNDIEALSEEARTLGLAVNRMVADLDLVIAAARQTGEPVFLISLIRQHYAQARAEGLSVQGCFLLLKYYETLQGE